MNSLFFFHGAKWIGVMMALAHTAGAAVIPRTPSHFRAAPGDGRITLSWESAGEAVYQVKRSTSPSGLLSIIATNVSAASLVDTDVQNGRNYFYAVSAVTSGVESPDSVRIRVMPSAPVLDWLPAGAKVEKLAGNFSFTEGPAWVPDPAGGYLVFSDINRLIKWTPLGAETFRRPSGAANGNTIDLEGRLITCEQMNKRVSRTEPDGTVTALVTEYNGRRFNSPNDVVVKSDGTIWFTDPTYGGTGQPGRYVYRFDPAAGNASVTPVVTDFDQPNGLCFSPDEKILYIADSGGPHHVRAFDVLPDNTLTNSRVFAVITPGVPDGIRADSAGLLYFTAEDGVQVFSPDGALLGKLRTPEAAANVGFGGTNNEMLFITARTSLYGISRMPDLVVTAISTTPLQPSAGQRTAFTVVVKNQGTAPAPAGIAVSLVLTNAASTNEFETVALTSPLEPDASVALPLAAGSGFWIATPGANVAWAVVDFANSVTESNETNNTFRATISVSDAPPDTDMDGSSDPDEVVAGTDIASADSSLRLISAEWKPAIGLQLRWFSIPGRNYRVAGKGTLDDLLWVDLTEPITAAGPETTWTNSLPASAAALFYRVRVLPP